MRNPPLIIPPKEDEIMYIAPRSGKDAEGVIQVQFKSDQQQRFAY